MSELPLFQRLLGDAWPRLPAAVRQLHTESHVAGRCVVERGSGLLAGLVASLVGFPAAADDLPVSVSFLSENGRERWTRTFGQQIFASTMLEGSGRLLCERIGPLDFEQELVVEGDRLLLVMRRWTLLRIPMPLWLAPRSNSYETEQDGRFRFHVEISHPWLGLIVRYRGWLVPHQGTVRPR